MNTKQATALGAGIGLGVFFIIGLLPAALYGGYAGVLLATGIFGSPLPVGFVSSALVTFGMVLGVVAVASLFSVLGAVAAAMIRLLTGKPSDPT
jgi:hypothetical protein